MTEKDETPVEIFPGLPALPKWVHEYCRDVQRYMAEHHPGYWAIDGVCKRENDASPHEPQASDYERAIEEISTLTVLWPSSMQRIKNRARAIALERGKSATIKDSLTVGHSDD